jgi:hypothetical protein
MNTISWVERYAYFFPASVPAVDVNGAITEAGLYWNDIISPASIALNIE